MYILLPHFHPFPATALLTSENHCIITCIMFLSIIVIRVLLINQLHDTYWKYEYTSKDALLIE